MLDQVSILPEPTLEFRYRQGVVDPRLGLTLFGPYDADLPSHPKSISYGLIGTSRGIEGFQALADAWRHPIPTPPGMSDRLWPLFPGFDEAFSCHWPSKPTRVLQVEELALERDSLFLDQHQRAASAVARYLEEIQKIKKGDERTDIVICVIPECVWANCRPKSRVSLAEGVGERITPQERREREGGQMGLFQSYDPAIYSYSPDFRRQLKARVMETGLPIQLVRESTLALTRVESAHGRQVTCLSDRAWNLGTAIYYKAGGKPWRLHTAREGVCYIGLAFRRKDPESASTTAACAAQMFLNSGDGLVFMGEFGPWYSEKRRECHLSKAAARDLLTGALRTYQEFHDQELKEIFLHCRSGLDREEFAGFSAACPRSVKLVGVRVRQEDLQIRLMREGNYPVMRGTFWRVNDRTGYLWGSGFEPTLGTYRGWEIPVPLRIDVQYGDATIGQVAQDILALTKLNYNACRVGDAEPVTVRFSNKVGEILVSNPSTKRPRPNFKFYI